MNEKQIKFIFDISQDFRDFGILDNVADFIACQFALESNFGRARMVETKHNYCGMKCPSYRPTLDLDFKPNQFARYRSLIECEIDYLLWLAYNRFNRFDLSCIDSFSRLLKAKSYCPEKDYIEKIQSIYQLFKNSTK